jgi:hypothetical protein
MHQLRTSATLVGPEGDIPIAVNAAVTSTEDGDFWQGKVIHDGVLQILPGRYKIILPSRNIYWIDLQDVRLIDVGKQRGEATFARQKMEIVPEVELLFPTDEVTP